MVRFFTDLDNTLIYSHRHQIPEPRICVEELRGKPQSFMSQKSYEYFRKQTWLDVIPITTRTIEQYQRLHNVAGDFKWHFAMICNGAILLNEGKEDIQWSKESILLSEKDQAAFEELCKRALDLYGKDHIVLVDKMMLYVKGIDNKHVYETLKAHSDPVHIHILRDTRKVYCLPVSLSKGNAVKRFLERSGETFSIAAGDSVEFDGNMVDTVNVFLYPETYQKGFDIQGCCKKCSGFFADTICDELEKIRAGE